VFPDQIVPFETLTVVSAVAFAILSIHSHQRYALLDAARNRLELDPRKQCP
jgi:hypothetical protein